MKRTFFFLPLLLLLSFFSLPAQSLVNISPDSAYQGQSLAVTISGQGTHFGQGSALTQVWLSQASITTIYTQFNIIQSSTLLDAHFTIPQNANLGLWDVNVWTAFDGHMQVADGFLIYDLGVGIEPELKSAFDSMEIFPNPLTENSRVRFTLQQAESMTIGLFDLNGKLILEVPAGEFAPGTHEIKLGGFEIASGTYLLKVAVKDAVFMQRVSLQ